MDMSTGYDVTTPTETVKLHLITLIRKYPSHVQTSIKALST